MYDAHEIAEKRGETTAENWLVFRDRETGRELLAYTIRGTFEEERAATIELLAAENGISPERITTTIEYRRPKI